MPGPLASVVIVSYNTRDLLRECLDSIERQSADLNHEVIVLDNASADGSAAMVREEFPAVVLIESDQNLGFARGVNEAVLHAGGTYVILLNPDTIVLDDALTALVRFAEANPRYGMYGGRTLNGERGLEPSSCWGAQTLWSLTCFALGLSTAFKHSALLDPESLGDWQRDSVREVGVVTGCLLLSRRDWFVELGGFDERYFMYGEDADLSMRSRLAGRPNVITPTAEIVHFVGGSASSSVSKSLQLMTGKATLARRRWSGIRQRYALGALVAGVALRAGLDRLAALRRPGSQRAWAAVLAARADWIDGFPEPTREPVFGASSLAG